MKTLKIGFIALTLMIGNATFGQKAKLTPEERANKKTEKMAKQLLLSPEQKVKVLEVNKNIAQKNEEVRKNSSISKDQKEAAIKENQNARNESLKTILNEEQMKKELELQKLREAKINEHKALKEKNKQTKNKGTKIKEEVETLEEEEL
jgi:hypothetical protein